MALAHGIDSKVEAAYQRGDLFEKRRTLTHEVGEPEPVNIWRHSIMPFELDADAALPTLDAEVNPNFDPDKMEN
jgi:hypothetical protein